jgi:excinuclease ABC subunit A
LVSQALVDLIGKHVGQMVEEEADGMDADSESSAIPTEGAIVSGAENIKRLVRVDQKPIGRTPRSNIATYTGLFDAVRKIFAATKAARARRFDAGRFSFNVAKGRCETCKGEGQVVWNFSSSLACIRPVPLCSGKRFNARTLEITYKDKSIADVLDMRVEEALAFFHDDALVCQSLKVL